jgi:hypothetical protein
MTTKNSMVESTSDRRAQLALKGCEAYALAQGTKVHVTWVTRLQRLAGIARQQNILQIIGWPLHAPSSCTVSGVSSVFVKNRTNANNPTV